MTELQHGSTLRSSYHQKDSAPRGIFFSEVSKFAPNLAGVFPALLRIKQHKSIYVQQSPTYIYIT
jgi:hypothetical protein